MMSKCREGPKEDGEGLKYRYVALWWSPMSCIPSSIYLLVQSPPMMLLSLVLAQVHIHGTPAQMMQAAAR